MDRQRFVDEATTEWPTVFRFALRLTRDRDRAEDLVQDVYVRAFRPDRIRDFEPQGGGVRAWLLRIAYRLFVTRNEQARSERERTLSLDDAPAPVRRDPIGRILEAPDAARARDFDWDGVDERIKAAIARLDPGARDVLLLWAIERLQYREIADVLDVPIGTVMSRLHRARTRVSEELLATPGAVEDLGVRTLPGRTAPRRPNGEAT